MNSLQTSLAVKSWFGFDLDDTLHEFRKASGAASLAVFEAIHQQYGVSVELLERSYASILAKMTANAFAEGKTSTEYRKERFAALLQEHRIDDGSTYVDDTYLDSLVAMYKKALAVQYLKRIGKRIIVITEGPRDAQEWTIEQLGLAPYVDILVTTNEMGKAKVDGLFDEVLRRYNIKAEEMLYVGDNEKRDVVPATDTGILAILYDEKGNCQLDATGEPDSKLRINSLTKLEHILDMGVDAAESEQKPQEVADIWRQG